MTDANYADDLALLAYTPAPTESLLHCFNQEAIGRKGRAFANGQGEPGSIPGRVIRNTQKMVLDTSLLNTQHYKVRIKGIVQQSREWSYTLLFTSVL